MTTNSQGNRISDNRIIVLLLISIVCATVCSAWFTGGRASLWAWEQFPQTLATSGMVIAVVQAGLYCGFYLFFYIAPFAVARLIIWSRYLGHHPRRRPDVERELSVFALCVGMASVVALPGLIAFWNVVRESNFVVASLLFLAPLVLGAYGNVREKLFSQLFVVIDKNGFVACACEQCGHSWAFPASKVEWSWMPADGTDRPDQNYQYPIK